MPWQLIYTSALRTLVPGQTGYGTVARSADLREALIQRLEQFSYYQHGTSPAAQTHVVCAYRILDLRGSRYHVLTRIQDAGLDFTSRTNHLAHHLVFEPAELATLPPPAVILLQWSGWRAQWQDEPRLLTEADWADLHSLPHSVPLPADHWQQITGDAGSAAALLERACASGCTVVADTGDESALLDLFAESAQLLDPDGKHPVKLWEHTFTTFLQAEDNAGDFRWRGCVNGSPGWQATQRTTIGALLPLRSIVAPDNPLAKLAREGRPNVTLTARPAAGVVSSVPSPGHSPTPYRLAERKPTSRTVRQNAASEVNPSASAHGITLDFTSPRVWVPLLVLLLVLGFSFTAFVRPGFLKSRTSNPNPAGGEPITHSSGPVLLDAAPPTAANPDKSGAKPKSTPPPSSAAIKQLESQTVACPTWLVVAENDSPLVMPKIAELDELLQKLFRDEPPLNPQAVECRVTVRQLDLSPGAGKASDLRAEIFGAKRIEARLPSGHGLELNGNNWNPERGEAQSVSFTGYSLRDAGVLAALLKPAGDATTFRAFRLIVLGDTRFGPIHLSRTLLLADQNSFEETLHLRLLEWLKNIRLADPSAHWQLRPSTAGDVNTDLLDNLSDAFRPPAGRELGFTAMREQLGTRLDQERGKLKRLEHETAQLRTQVQEARPVGETLMGHTNELASLGSYIKAAKQRRFDRATYVEYLKAVLSGVDARLAEFVPPPDAGEDAARQAFQRLHEALARKEFKDKVRQNPPPPFYLKSWNDLGGAPALERAESELQQCKKLVPRFEGFLNAVPPDLEHTPRVSLVLVTARGQRYEIIRFTEP